MLEIICKWKGHKYDVKKYRDDLENYYSLNKDRFFNKKEIENYYNNNPIPFCKRCEKYIKP